jgi:AAA15 family ATPase/GTPase
MKILEYHYQDVDDPGWDFAKVKFGKINLLVGDTATGKSRLLNTIFNLGRFVAAKEFKNGSWEIVFEHGGNTYTWSLKTEKRDDERRPGIVVRDYLWRHDGHQLTPLVERDSTSFSFAGQQTPKLSPSETSISLLQEEEAIQPLHQAFSIIERRLFNQDALRTASELHTLPRRVIDMMEEKKDVLKIFEAQMNLSANLFVLSKYFNDTYKQIVENYRKIFPFVQEARLMDFIELQPNLAASGPLPVFTVRERGSDRWIPVTEFSSGMQKVLLILTDVFILPNGGVYIIDEYENSLGINAIDFFPQFVLELDKDIQFIITSHHPYIINEIPSKNWYVFHRNGMQVSIRYGDELTEKFGRSKQQAFIQLINDPFFTQGVE